MSPASRRWLDDPQRTRASLEPAREDHVRKVADVVVVVMGDEDRMDAFDWDPGPDKLQDRSAARVEEETDIPDLEGRR